MLENITDDEVVPRDPPACYTCRHFWRGDQGNTCDNPAAKPFDPVWGRTSQVASLVRANGAACGPEGKLYEPRPTQKRDPMFWVVIIFAGLAAAGWLWENRDHVLTIVGGAQ